MSELLRNKSVIATAGMKIVALGLTGTILAGCGESNPDTTDDAKSYVGSQTIGVCPDGYVSTKEADKITDTKNAYGALQQGVAVLINKAASTTHDTQAANDKTYLYDFAIESADLPAVKAIFQQEDDYSPLDGSYIIAGASTAIDDLSEVFCNVDNATYFMPQATTAIGALTVAGINLDLVNGSASLTN